MASWNSTFQALFPGSSQAPPAAPPDLSQSSNVPDMTNPGGNSPSDTSGYPGFDPSPYFPTGLSPATGAPASQTYNPAYQYALNELEPQTTTTGTDSSGNPTGSQTIYPDITTAETTGLNLGTPAGLDTLGTRVAFNDPNAEFIQDTFPNSNTPSGNAAQNVYSWLSQGGPYQETTSGGQNDTALYPDPGNPNYTPGGAPGSVDLTQAGMNLAASDFNAGQGQNTGPPAWVLSLPVDLLSAGAGLYATLGADAGIAAADAGASTAADVATSDLGAITAGAGAAGGAAGSGVGAGLAASLGDTLNLLDPTMASGIQAADAASAIAGGVDPAVALQGISGVADLAGTAAGAADAGNFLPGPGDLSGTSSGVAPITADGGDFLPGPGDLGTTGAVAAGPVSPGAGGLVSTADAGIDPTVLGADTAGLGPTGGGDLTLAASTADPASSGSGFFSDLTSGNFGNLGQDVSNWFSSNPPVADVSNAAGEGDASDFPATGEGSNFLPGPGDLTGDAGSSGGGSWLSTLGNKFVQGLSDPFKLLGLGASGIGLGYNLLKANQSNPIPGMSNVQSAANQLTTQGATLQNYLTTGTLPAGVQASLDQATNSAIQSVKSNFASRGIAPGSTMEQQQIAAIQQNAAAQGGQLALNLLNSGVQMSDLGAQLYQSLVSTNVALNSQTEQAISNLASALAGGNRITLQTAPGTTVAP
jgi:hypothetical protein